MICFKTVKRFFVNDLIDKIVFTARKCQEIGLPSSTFIIYLHPVKAVILINFGGPRSGDEIRPFLKDIFKDVLPWPLKPMAPLLAWLREGKASHMYAAIGGASPVVSWTRWQAVELEKRLNTCHCEPSEAIQLIKQNTGDCRVAQMAPRNDKEFKVYIGMKYGSPSIEDAMAEAREDGADKIITLPLFPYHSKYTYMPGSPLTGSGRTGPAFSWHDHPLYIDAIVSTIRAELSKQPNVPPIKMNLIFSVHAIPVKDAKVEPYVREVEESVSLIMRHFTGCNYQIAYQSATGPIRWTKPSTKSALKKFILRQAQDERDKNSLMVSPSNHERSVLVIPLGFNCENIETLYEIDKLYIPMLLDSTAKGGLARKIITRTPALNNNPQFIDLAYELVLDAFHE